MKSIKKFLFVMVALATALAFVSCNNDDDDDGVVAVYKFSEGGLSLKITCFDNGQWEMIEDASGAEPEMWGTYEGDPSNDGEIKITVTGSAGGSDDEKGSPYTVNIKSGSFEFDGLTFKRQ
ncbi:MAG: hypothetical protein HDR53_03770 [Treponema sp.]|nr:hypothetical protein [Treponema sp.]